MIASPALLCGKYENLNIGKIEKIEERNSLRVALEGENYTIVVIIGCLVLQKSYQTRYIRLMALQIALKTGYFGTKCNTKPLF